MRIDLFRSLGEGVVSYDGCAFWFKWFKSGNFSVIDKQRPESPRKRDNDDLLAENSMQTQKELAEQLGATQITLLRTTTNVS